MNNFMRTVTAFFAAICLFFSNFGAVLSGNTIAEISVDASNQSGSISNIVSNINVWKMGKQFINPTANTENNVFDFVQYVQLMQCSGGNESRDLFIDPYDTSTLTDYDFSSLIGNCKGILSLGAKPLLILGSVPMKMSSGYKLAGFDTNIYPPDDYNDYYIYIKAIAQSLVDEFGIDEVRTWRFGCMTEYENSDWFMATSGTPEDSAIEYCKLYDYTVQALLDVIGNDVFVGAHSMTVTEGLWDEDLFIKHVAEGTNYANGGKGTHIDYLSASFYDMKPGQYTSGKTLPETINYLRNSAEKYGLTNLIYGIDEGRMYSGNTSGTESDQLNSRTVGYTYQAAYDARLYTQGIRNGLDYFSSWNYLSGGIFKGNPTVAYHVADRISEFAGNKSVETSVTSTCKSSKAEIDCLAGWNEDTDTLNIMTYNFKNDLSYSKNSKTTLNISVPQLDGKTVTVTKYSVNDDCNFFDEWIEDRKTYNITDDCFSWSPDDPTIDSTSTLKDENARNIYKKYLKDKYKECSKLVPETETATVKDGKLTLKTDLGGNTVVFYQITEQ